MANDLTGNPYVIDNNNTNSANCVSGMKRIYSIEWHNYTNNTSRCIVLDGKNRTLFNSIGKADLTPIKGGAEGWVDGIKVDTLSSGVLLIYYR